MNATDEQIREMTNEQWQKMIAEEREQTERFERTHYYRGWQISAIRRMFDRMTAGLDDSRFAFTAFVLDHELGLAIIAVEYFHADKPDVMPSHTGRGYHLNCHGYQAW